MIGTIESIWRYPVKSMRGESLDEIFVAFSGLMGDRVFALTSSAAPKEFPWHTSREQETLLLNQARFKDRGATLAPDNMSEAMANPANLHAPFPNADAFAVEVETPSGAVHDLRDPAFLKSIAEEAEAEIGVRESQRSLVDCRPVTLFSLQTVRQLAEETGEEIHKLQFRSNFYIDWKDQGGFYEDELVGKRVGLGDTVELMILERDPRCKLITIHPETAESSPKLLRHVTKAHEGFAGVYAAVLKEGPVEAGAEVKLLD